MGLVAEIGPGSICFNADQGNAYVVGAGHSEALSSAQRAQASSSGRRPEHFQDSVSTLAKDEEAADPDPRFNKR
jgi:hypothetical protein